MASGSCCGTGGGPGGYPAVLKPGPPPRKGGGGGNPGPGGPPPCISPPAAKPGAGARGPAATPGGRGPARRRAGRGAGPGGGGGGGGAERRQRVGVTTPGRSPLPQPALSFSFSFSFSFYSSSSSSPPPPDADLLESPPYTARPSSGRCPNPSEWERLPARRCCCEHTMTYSLCPPSRHVGLPGLRPGMCCHPLCARVFSSRLLLLLPSWAGGLRVAHFNGALVPYGSGHARAAPPPGSASASASPSWAVGPGAARLAVMSGCFRVAVGDSGRRLAPESHRPSPRPGGRSITPGSHRFSQNDTARPQAGAAPMQGRMVLGLAFVAAALVCRPWSATATVRRLRFSFRTRLIELERTCRSRCVTRLRSIFGAFHDVCTVWQV